MSLKERSRNVIVELEGAYVCYEISTAQLFSTEAAATSTSPSNGEREPVSPQSCKPFIRSFIPRCLIPLLPWLAFPCWPASPRLLLVCPHLSCLTASVSEDETQLHLTERATSLWFQHSAFVFTSKGFYHRLWGTDLAAAGSLRTWIPSVCVFCIPGMWLPCSRLPPAHLAPTVSTVVRRKQKRGSLKKCFWEYCVRAC